jgi:adenine-specific DNA-methyltransferase
MKGQSLDIKNDRLSRLKEIFPEVFTEEKVDWEKLKATLGEDIVFENERYLLNWAGKSDAFRVLQEPTTATLVPSKKESVNFDDTDHIFIEGENLEVLKVLQKSYYGKVKMIYIDPPYNTGNDSFIYPDRFSEKKDDYLKRVGDKDEQGYMTREGLFRKNNKESGHYHSNWLNMMYPRLFLARNLLRDDGVIFVSIDDNEVHNLRLIMNEIFGEESFVALFPWKKRTTKSDVPFGVSQDYEWLICYCKQNFIAGLPSERKYHQSADFPNNRWRLADLTKQTTAVERPNSAYDLIDPKTGKRYPYNPKRVWAVTKDTFQKYYDKGKIVFPDDYDFINISVPAFRVFEDEDMAKAREKFASNTPIKTISTSLLKDIGMNEDGNKEMVELFGGKIFSFPKPSSFVKHFLAIVNDRNAIVMDFFAGSGTTAHAVLDLNKEDDGNRKFICVQMPEKTEEGSEAYKAGYKTISDIAKERIRRVIDKINKEQEDKKDLITELEDKKPLDLGFKVFKLQPSNFKIWHGSKFENDEDLLEQLDAFTDPVKQGSQEENILFELLLKSGFDLNSKIEFKNSIFIVNKDEMVLALSKIDEPIINEIVALKPQKCLALDRLFQGNDQLKTNTVLQMKDAKIEFRTV